jgi:uncharacterized BrkB/YihY/UPF0761 family membrane protein
VTLDPGDERLQEPPVGETPVSRRERLEARAAAARARGEEIVARLEGERPHNMWVETGFRWLARDKEIAGGVLAGGLAYRFFFWTMSITLFLAGGLGIAHHANTGIGEATEDAGLSTSLSQTIADAAQQSDSGRFWLLIIGAWLTLWFSWGLIRAMRLVYADAWKVPLTPMRNLPRAILIVLMIPIAFGIVSVATTWVRANTGFFLGLVVTLAVGGVFVLVWAVACAWLPSEEVPLSAHLPGAVVVGVSFAAIQVFVAYFLATKLAGASELYGILGLATTLLFFLFMIGRVIVWSAELNAVFWRVRQERKEAAGPS